MKLRTKVAPLALGLVFAVSTARVAGAQTPPPQPAAQPAAQPARPARGPARGPACSRGVADATFSGSVGVLLVQVKARPGGRLREPDHQAEGIAGEEREAGAQGDGRRLEGLQVGRAAWAGNTLYVHIVDPVSAGQNYLETYKLISETFPAEVQDLYGKTKDAFVPGGLGRLNLTLVTALGGS